MKTFALIGKRLVHSYSKMYFDEKFARLGLNGCRYLLCEMESTEGLREWVKKERIAGFNVTIPYKREVAALVDELSGEAAETGAVNCVRVEGDRLVGYNTDAAAFRQSLENTGYKADLALVLGTGGAARAVGYALRLTGTDHLYVSRHPRGKGCIGYEALMTLALPAATLIVNATPVGMYPDTGSSPWPCPERIAESHLAYDLTYNPSPTAFMRQAMERGAQAKDGLEMLHRQAELSWEVFSAAAGKTVTIETT